MLLRNSNEFTVGILGPETVYCNRYFRCFVSWSWQRVCVLYPCYVIVKVIKLFRRNTYVNPQYLEASIVLSVAACLRS